jgi:hypothetical protein
MVPEKFLSRAAMVMPMVMAGHMVPQVLDAFYKLVLGMIGGHSEADIAADKIHFHVLHAFLLQVFIYRKRAIGAAHTLYFPIHFFHGQVD